MTPDSWASEVQSTQPGPTVCPVRSRHRWRCARRVCPRSTVQWSWTEMGVIINYTRGYNIIEGPYTLSSSRANDNVVLTLPKFTPLKGLMNIWNLRKGLWVFSPNPLGRTYLTLTFRYCFISDNRSPLNPAKIKLPRLFCTTWLLMSSCRNTEMRRGFVFLLVPHWHCVTIPSNQPSATKGFLQ